MILTALLPMPHLEARTEALALFGWTGAAAEWLALVCRHSGVCTRAQMLPPLRCGALGRPPDRPAAGRGGGGRRATAHRPPENRSAVRLFGRRLYRALGVEHIRHLRLATEDVVFRRLFSLNFVIERPDLPGLRPRWSRWPASRRSGSSLTPFPGACREEPGCAHGAPFT